MATHFLRYVTIYLSKIVSELFYEKHISVTQTWESTLTYQLAFDVFQNGRFRFQLLQGRSINKRKTKSLLLSFCAKTSNIVVEPLLKIWHLWLCNSLWKFGLEQCQNFWALEISPMKMNSDFILEQKSNLNVSVSPTLHVM